MKKLILKFVMLAVFISYYYEYGPGTTPYREYGYGDQILYQFDYLTMKDIKTVARLVEAQINKKYKCNDADATIIFFIHIEHNQGE